jgi:hypothetical protein
MGPLEGLVVPVEAAAGLGGRNQESEEDRAEERLVFRGAGARVRMREDRGSRLTAELFDGEPGVLASAQDRLTFLDEGADERAQFVQRGPATLNVLLEGEGEIPTFLELAPQNDERPEDESA